MKPLTILFFIAFGVFCSGCSSSEETVNFALPQLIYQHPLPAFPKPLSSSMMRVPLEIHVANDGRVTDVRIVSGSGVDAWDSAAIAAIRQWRYTPARTEGRPIGLWLHQTAVVKFTEPRYMALAEIICNCRERVDSAYRMLLSGGDFAAAVQVYSGADSRINGGRLGIVNIQVYPEPLRKVIAALDTNQFTAPIPFGDQFGIFLRVPERRVQYP